MTCEMNPNVINELQRRFGLLMDNFHLLDPISRGSTGSMVRLTAILAPIGYPFEPKPWMDDEYLKPLMTDEVFLSGTYDSLFDIMMEKVQKRGQEKYDM